MKKLKILLFLILLNGQYAAADMFKCKLPDGSLKFQDKPCASSEKQLERKEMQISSTSYDSMDRVQVTTYMALVECIDQAFYEDGHDEDDPQRDGLINKELKSAGLPEYVEAKYNEFEKNLDRKKLFDAEKYMQLYSECIDRQPDSNYED